MARFGRGQSASPFLNRTRFGVGTLGTLQGAAENVRLFNVSAAARPVATAKAAVSMMRVTSASASLVSTSHAAAGYNHDVYTDVPGFAVGRSLGVIFTANANVTADVGFAWGAAYGSTVIVPGSPSGPGGTAVGFRWTFSDGWSSYTFEINPNSGGSPVYQRTYGQISSSAPDGTALVWEGRSAPLTGSFSGVVRSQDQHQAMVDWFSKVEPVQVVDDLGRVFWVLITGMKAQRAPHRLAPWRHTYQVDYTVLTPELV